ncbi:MAG: choice-of-anchor J domain-containing protein [Muribaculaceae bacterium]|nr:choice-of-anchor J domain-containing protein [Muribaculaceae bacterium]
MKRILNRIVSVALAAAMTTSPVIAQTAKKATVAGADPRNATVAMKAEPRKAQGKNASKFIEQKARTVSSGLRDASRHPAAPSRVVTKAAGDMPVLYGSITYSDDFASSSDVGLYKVAESATDNPELLIAGVNAQNGGVCVDGVYYATSYFSFFGMIFITVEAFDVEFGEKVDSYSPDDLAIIAPGGYALDPTDNSVYGITYNSAGSGLQLSKLSFGNGEPTATAVGALAGNWNSIAIDAQGQIYGISYEGVENGDDYVVTNSYLNKIDKTTGAVTLIGETGVAPQYLSSATIDKKSGRMFWNVCPPDETGWIYEVNLTSGHADALYQLPGNDEIMGMYVPEPAAEPGAPASCENVNFNFGGGSLMGICSLTTPSLTYDGSAGSGTLTVTVLANGEVVSTMPSASWGRTVTLPVNLTEKGAGMYTFTVYATGDGGEGVKTRVKNVWVGSDTPSATKASLAYVNGNMEVTWNAVTGTVNGGYLDTDALTYKVVRADGSVAAEGLTTTSFSEAVAEPETLTSYSYTVYAVCGDLVSAPAETNTVVLGFVVPPYAPDFAADGLEGWTVIDANGDGKVWTAQADGSVRMTYNSSLEMDDWMITPPLKLEAGKNYLVSFAAKSNGASFPERFEVKYGTSATVEGMSSVLVAPTQAGAAYEEYSEYLSPTADGVYYVGFHGISDPDMYYLYIKDIRIEAGVADGAPGVATNLVVTPDAAGELKANVSFNAPDKNMKGETLSSLTKVELYRGETLVNTWNNPAKGSACSYEDTPSAGTVTYKVVGYNEYGAGKAVQASAFIGFNTPLAPASASVAETSVKGEVIVSWDAVTQDVDGKPLPADKLTYTLFDADGIVAENISTTSYTYQAVPADSQDFVQYGVYAVITGIEGGKAYTDMIPVGTPYTSLNESFAEGKLHYIWGMNTALGGNVTILSDDSGIPSQDGDGYFLGISGQYLDTGASFFSGLISLDQMENPGLSFYVFDVQTIAENPDIDEITVSIRTSGSDYTEVLSSTVQELCADATDGWGKVLIPLGAYSNKTIQFMITGITKQYVYKAIDNIRVGSIFAYDLEAKGITAPAKVPAGSDYKVEVAVSNAGAQSAASYTVELYADEELVASKDCSNLESGASTVVSFDRNMSALASDPVTYFAKIVYSADMDDTNNQTSSVTVTPVVSTLPKATGLAGTSAAEGIRLTWSEPNLEGGVSQPVTDDFEDAESFANHYGDWTFVDVDQYPVGGFQGTEIPGITLFETTGSYWVWDHALLGNDSFKAHSGEKYLFTLFNSDGQGGVVQNNEWAISPELDGSAQTISFYARSYSADYPEKVSVYYSTGSLQPSDFVKINGAGAASVPGDWTLFEAQLPAGAKHFAIVCESYDAFSFMVDDVTYTPAGTANLEIEGYNVYRDGVKINDAPVQETEYLDTNVVSGETYAYVVTVIYKEKGESAPTDEVVVSYTGVDGIAAGGLAIKAVGNDIIVLNAEGLGVTVASASGAVIYSGAGEVKTVISVGSGVYVVTAGKTVRKVLIK